MTEFNITEPGFYKQVNGGKAEYVGRDSKGRYIGVDSDGSFVYWSKDGSHSEWNDFNLIAPWVEPKKVMVDCWMNVDEWGLYNRYYETKEDADHFAHGDRIACLHIQREVTEGEGL